MDRSAHETRLDLNDVGPEVKSYIYQLLTEFEPFTTEDTTVSVIAKDPLGLLKNEDLTDSLPSRSELKKIYRISMSLKEDDTKIEAEGWDADIYIALRKAKDALLAKLIEIQDKVMNNQERIQQIHHARNGTTVH